MRHSTHNTFKFVAIEQLRRIATLQLLALGCVAVLAGASLHAQQLGSQANDAGGFESAASAESPASRTGVETTQPEIGQSLADFRFQSFDVDLVPRNFFAEHQMENPVANNAMKEVTLHQLYVEPPRLVHQRLYFEERAFERCGQVSCHPNQGFVSAARFFSRGILFPATVTFSNPRQKQCTNRDCP